MNFPFGSKSRRYLQAMLNNEPDAVAVIKGDSAHKNLKGTVAFFQLPEGVLVRFEVSGLPEKKDKCSNSVFGFHIHEGKSCTGNAEDPFADAKAHYNPTNCPHPEHAGDLQPLFANNGFAWGSFLTNRFKVEEVLGRTVIVHGSADDFHTQPSGDSGMKIGCGIIRR